MSQRGSGFERIASDEYMTPHWAVQELVQALHLDTGMFWDPACGTQNVINAIAQMLDTGSPLAPVRMLATDIQPKYDPSGQGVDFTNGQAGFMVPEEGPLHIITNPPYGTQGRVAIQFIEVALQMTAMVGGTVSMLLRVDFDSAKTRRWMFADCPAFDSKLILTNRLRWTNLEQKLGSGPSENHAWFHWNHQRRPGLPVVQYLGMSDG